MKETLGHLLMQVRGAWRFRWYALAMTWAWAFHHLTSALAAIQ